MRTPGLTCAVSLIATLLSVGSARTLAESPIQVGPRPAYLIDQLAPGALKTQLEGCLDKPVQRSRFSIAHRGAPLQFPEHTRESYLAAARMGAGMIECDVTFTKDRELVCRHDQCDLHATTNILSIPTLSAKCSAGFTPFDP
ncbi:MAG TPA: glycerophosphodiester phosphodiesterase family protein, partial [Aquimonas sp.]|nr:glycerophosphodiester phosphodiesterase family protein [Aquimonas sp.]